MILAQIQTALYQIYPDRCVGCGVLVEGDLGLCTSCWSETQFARGVCCRSCGVPLIGGQIGEIAECDACLRHPRPWDQGRTALVYEGMARRLVLRLKHGDRTDIVRPAAGWMLWASDGLIGADTVLVPVPQNWRRFLKRTYNQAALLAQDMARCSGVTCCPDALLRDKATAPMSGARANQVQAIKNAFRVNPRRLAVLEGRPVVLIDDVMTSGATLEAASLALGAARVGKIDVITLARVAMDL